MYTIKPDNLSAFDVFCDQTTAGGGWTVFQKRIDGLVNFYLNWRDYKHGFGDLTNEFWLGNDKIHRLTSDYNKRLRVDMEDFEGNTAYAEYDMFGVMSESDMYKLKLGSYSGDLIKGNIDLLFPVAQSFKIIFPIPSIPNTLNLYPILQQLQRQIALEISSLLRMSKV